MPAARTRPVTSRDQTILEDLGLVTVASYDLIRRHHFVADRTGKSCQRRLRLLRHAGLLTPVLITSRFGTSNERATVFRFTPVGADWLAQKTGRPVRLLRTDPKADTLLHRVMVARTVLAVNDAARHANLLPPVWLLENDRWPDAARTVSEPKLYRFAFDFLAVPPQPGRPSGTPRPCTTTRRFAG